MYTNPRALGRAHSRWSKKKKKKRNPLIQRMLAIVINNIDEEQWTHKQQSPPSRISARQKASVLELKGTFDGWDPGVPGEGGGGESWGGQLSPATRRSQGPHPRQGWYPSREPAVRPVASRGAGSEAGAGERGEGRPGECPRLFPRFHKSPQPRRPPGREVHGVGAQRGGTRHLPLPRRWLSFFQCAFFVYLFLFF